MSSIFFQLALAFGIPWGKASMGGKFPGKYSKKMRFFALFSAVFLLCLMIITISRTGIYFTFLHSFSYKAIWFIVVFFFFQTIMNTITPSK